MMCGKVVMVTGRCGKRLWRKHRLQGEQVYQQLSPAKTKLLLQEVARIRMAILLLVHFRVMFGLPKMGDLLGKNAHHKQSGRRDQVQDSSKIKMAI